MAFPGVVGQILGHYRIVGPLGAGGMGEVYRARDTRLERDVAIKILPARTADDDGARARLLREARTASQLNHPNICTIHEVGEAGGQAFIAMELVKGQPLSATLSRGPLAPDLVVRFGLQLADALAHAHQNNVVHRDLKSGNVMVTPEGRVKVLDFGLAKRVAESSPEAATQSQLSLTRPGAVVGTLGYMAPEQFRGQPADTRSDVWGVGVVLYEMASGALPFGGRTGFEMSAAIIERQPAPLPAGIPQELCAVIGRCLEKEPPQRYQNGGEIKAALEAIQTGTAAGSTSVRRRSSRWLPATIAIATIVLAAIAAGLNLDRMRSALGGAPRIESIAVLPLANLSGDPQQEYFADGMTEALITDLGRLTGLKRVIARGSVARYKGSNMPLGQVARELNVDALVTGAVVRSGGRVRLTAQLVEPQTGAEIWSQKYERDLRDVLQLQSELTGAIAGEIRLKLAAEEKRRLARVRTVNPEAYDAYLQGRFNWQKVSREGYDTAERYFQLALRKDPNYALAYTGLGIVWGQRCTVGVVRCSEALPKWHEAIQKALELDPSLPEAQAQAAAITFYVDWNWAAAGRQLEQAIAGDPNYPEAHFWYMYWLLCVGRREEAVAEARRGLQLDPYNSLYKWYVADALLKARHDDEAIEYLQQLLQADPRAPRARATLRLAYEIKGMHAEAMTQWRRILADSGDKETAKVIDEGYAHGGYRLAMRLRADLAVERSQRQYIQASQIAFLYAAAGEKELAIDWLEREVQDHEPSVVGLTCSPRLDVLRDHPRFKALMRRLNLPHGTSS